MDTQSLFNDVLRLAKTAEAVLTGGVVANGLEVGKKVIGIIDDLTDGAPDARTQSEMQTARASLSAAVEAKAKATSARLRGQ